MLECPSLHSTIYQAASFATLLLGLFRAPNKIVQNATNQQFPPNGGISAICLHSQCLQRGQFPRATSHRSTQYSRSHVRWHIPCDAGVYADISNMAVDRIELGLQFAGNINVHNWHSDVGLIHCTFMEQSTHCRHIG